MKKDNSICFGNFASGIAIFVLALASLIYSNNSSENLKKGLQIYAQEFAPENIYVQTDKPYYTSGDTIWFKTYLVNAITHIPNAVSKIAYVELIAPDTSLIASRELFLENGGGAGVFEVPENASGNYLLRAYTNHLRNEGADYFFEQSIPVFFQDLEEKGNLASDAFSSSIELNDVQRPNVRFFPEGGDLVQDIATTVGVKASVNAETGIELKGKIVDETGEVHAKFETRDFGLGAFPFTPEAGKTYTALVDFNGKEEVYSLPAIKKKGFVLNVSSLRSRLIVEVEASEEEALLGAYVLGHLRGQLFFHVPIKKKVKRIEGIVPTSKLRDGIATFTLFSKAGEPLCERLVFVQSESDDVQVEVATNRKTYGKREKVELNIALNALSDSTSAKERANLSVAITDLGSVRHNAQAENIKTWLLLNADLRGVIENPNFFFEAGADSRRAYLLDALLLTHGWRRFTWKAIGDSNFPEKYEKEAGFFFDGKVTNLYNEDKPINSNVFFTAPQAGIFMEEQQTGEDGLFRFGPYQLKDTVDILIQARQLLKEKKKKRKKGITKMDGKRNVSIVMNETIERPPLKAADNEGAFEKDKQSILENYLAESQRQKRTDRQYDMRLIELEGVEVKARRTKQNIYDERAKTENIYGTPSNRLILDSIPASISLVSIFELLRMVPGVTVAGTFPNQNVTIRGIGSLNLSSAPLYILDGIAVDAQAISIIPVSDVEFIDVLKGPSAAIYGSRGGNGVIIVYTRRGNSSSGQRERKPGIINFQHNGYYKAREFYSPDYAIEKDIHIKPDFRTTLFWSPDVIVKDGVAKLSFYTADVVSDYNIRIEGISGAGVPIFVEETFRVVADN
ncbi:MAG: TonB-dependent receptor plug domain-containing protein [Bacteroidota bacterium]